MEPRSAAVKGSLGAALYMLARHARPDDPRVNDWLTECLALRKGLLTETPGDRTVRGDLAATLMLMTDGNRSGTTAAEKSLARDRLEEAVNLRRGRSSSPSCSWRWRCSITASRSLFTRLAISSQSEPGKTREALTARASVAAWAWASASMYVRHSLGLLLLV